MQKIHKNLIIAGSIIVVVAICAVLYFVFGNTDPLSLHSVAAKNGDITEQISLTGQVKASEGVDLAFESQGKVVRNYVKVGDKIYAGEPLLAIDSSVLQAQLSQAQAQLSQAQAQSDGIDINTVESQTNVGLEALYATSLSDAQKSVSTAKDILLTMSDIQFNHFTGETQQNDALHDAMEKSIYSLLGQQNAVLWSSQNVAQLNGGAFGLVQNAVNNPTQDNIDLALLSTKTALQDVSDLVNAVPIDPSLSATERAEISASKTDINLEIITTSSNIQSIASLKVNNSAKITTTNSQIEAAKAGVEVTQASIDSIKTQIAKTVLTALFNGQVDKNNALVGQIVSPNVPVITISNNNLEIDTDIPEIDISNAKIGDSGQCNFRRFWKQYYFSINNYFN